MPTLSDTRIAELLRPYLFSPELVSVVQPTLSTDPNLLYAGLSAYLDLLLKWNARTNLTAIRSPEEIVKRHFGESLFAARALAATSCTRGSALDFGSGAGFPGIPVQLLLPELQVVLAESQRKKASFLREAVRTLGLRAEVWDGRVEDLPASRSFDVVMLRAVDKMAEATVEAVRRVTETGLLLVMTSHPALNEGSVSWKIPEGETSRVVLTCKSALNVPRGTPGI